MTIKDALRKYLINDRFEDLLDRTAKFLFQHCDFEKKSEIWAAIHNKLVDIFGTGMIWKEDQDKIRESKTIQPITKKDANNYAQAIQQEIVELEKRIIFLKSKENALNNVLDLTFNWQI